MIQLKVIQLNEINIGQQTKFQHCSFAHDQNHVKIHNCAETMSNGDESAIAKMLANGTLNQIVGIRVDRCCRFVHQQHFGTAQQRSSQTQQLTLSDRQR